MKEPGTNISEYSFDKMLKRMRENLIKLVDWKKEEIDGIIIIQHECNRFQGIHKNYKRYSKDPAPVDPYQNSCVIEKKVQFHKTFYMRYYAQYYFNPENGSRIYANNADAARRIIGNNNSVDNSPGSKSSENNNHSPQVTIGSAGSSIYFTSAFIMTHESRNNDDKISDVSDDDEYFSLSSDSGDTQDKGCFTWIKSCSKTSDEKSFI